MVKKKKQSGKTELEKVMVIGVLLGVAALYAGNLLFVEYKMVSTAIWQYPKFAEEYKVGYNSLKGSQLNRTWAVVKEYYNNYPFHDLWSGRSNECMGRPIKNPIITAFVSHIQPKLYNRYILLEGYGCCEEAAVSITELVKITSHLKTRIVSFKGNGVGHAVPEVYYNRTWYVFDLSWTTPKRPIPANEYYRYLNESKFYKMLCASSVRDTVTFKDLKKEHGFPDEPNPKICGKNK